MPYRCTACGFTGKMQYTQNGAPPVDTPLTVENVGQRAVCPRCKRTRLVVAGVYDRPAPIPAPVTGWYIAALKAEEQEKLRAGRTRKPY